MICPCKIAIPLQRDAVKTERILTLISGVKSRYSDLKFFVDNNLRGRAGFYPCDGEAHVFYRSEGDIEESSTIHELMHALIQREYNRDLDRPRIEEYMAYIPNELTRSVLDLFEHECMREYVQREFGFQVEENERVTEERLRSLCLNDISDEDDRKFWSLFFLVVAQWSDAGSIDNSIGTELKKCGVTDLMAGDLLVRLRRVPAWGVRVSPEDFDGAVDDFFRSMVTLLKPKHI